MGGGFVSTTCQLALLPAVKGGPPLAAKNPCPKCAEIFYFHTSQYSGKLVEKSCFNLVQTKTHDHKDHKV